MSNWKEVAKQFEYYLRLRTFPTALKLYESVEEMEGIPKIKKPEWRATLCQLVTIARTFGWTVGATEKEFISPYCPSIVGFCPPPKSSTDGRQMKGIWFETQEEARNHQKAMQRIPLGKFKAMAISPLSSGKIEKPDMIIIYGTPAQMVRLLTGIQWQNYERLNFYYVGESACTDFIGECYKSQKPSLTIPCFGERRYGGVQEDELVIAIPPQDIDKILKGLEATQKSGLRYPIPFYGCQVDVMGGMPQQYVDLMKEEKG